MFTEILKFSLFMVCMGMLVEFGMAIAKLIVKKIAREYENRQYSRRRKEQRKRELKDIAKGSDYPW